MRTTVFRSLCGGCVAVATYVSVAAAQDSTQAVARIAGCYAVELGPWSGSFPSGSPASHQPPPTIRLDTAQFVERYASRVQHRQLAPPITVAGRQRVSLGRWRVAGDTLVMSWSDGFSGVSLSLGLRPDSLRGGARAFYDVIGPVQPTAPVLLRRVVCPLGLRDAAG